MDWVNNLINRFRGSANHAAVRDSYVIPMLHSRPIGSNFEEIEANKTKALTFYERQKNETR
jgi:hypothetical protein